MQRLSPSPVASRRGPWIWMPLLLGALAVGWQAHPANGARPDTAKHSKTSPNASRAGAAPRKAAVKTAAQPRPDKRMTPDQVVRFQMEALQHNDSPKPDSGIATTFAFASPQNRLATGPLEHFAQIVKSPAYLPMLNCKKITYDTIVIDGETAQQRVHIVSADGSRIAYIFVLSRQADGPFAGCWMNDGCTREDPDADTHRFDA